MATLAVLIGRAPEVVRRPRRQHVRGSRSRAVTPGLPSDLLTQRPDIREAEALLAAANANVEAARAAFFPTIQLTGEGGYQSAALQDAVQPGGGVLHVAAGLTQPIFDGFRLQGLFDLQKGRQDELLQLYRKRRDHRLRRRRECADRRAADWRERERAAARGGGRARAAPSRSRRRGCAKARSTWSPCSTPSRPCSRRRTCWRRSRFARLQAIVSLFQALGGGWPMPDRRLPHARRRALRAKRSSVPETTRR